MIDLYRRILNMVERPRKSDETIFTCVNTKIKELEKIVQEEPFLIDKENREFIDAAVNMVLEVVQKIDASTRCGDTEKIKLLDECRIIIKQYFYKNILLYGRLGTGKRGETDSFFRIVRETETFQIKVANDCFHIPFELSEKMRSNRYSAKGMPALYLANNLFGCFLEVNKDDKDYPRKQYFIKMDYLQGENGPRPILDLSLMPYEHYISKGSFNMFESLLIRLPIIIASMIKCEDENDEREAENYIFPQLLMGFIVESGNTEHIEHKRFIGIRYTSARLPIDDSVEFCNYVFPTFDSSRGYGFCPVLTKHFLLSEPFEIDEKEAIVVGYKRYFQEKEKELMIYKCLCQVSESKRDS